MLKSKEWTEETHNTALKGFRLFTLCPQHSVGVKHVPIDTRILYHLCQEVKLWPKQQKMNEKQFRKNEEENWNAVFKIKPRTLDRGIAPWHFIRTDGIAASVTFLREKEGITKEEKAKEKERKLQSQEKKQQKISSLCTD